MKCPKCGRGMERMTLEFTLATEYERKNGTIDLRRNRLGEGEEMFDVNGPWRCTCSGGCWWESDEQRESYEALLELLSPAEWYKPLRRRRAGTGLPASV
jgi:hypothetical protein